jgi:hypothetical protein
MLFDKKYVESLGLKVGDLVRIIGSFNDDYTIGEVVAINYDGVEIIERRSLYWTYWEIRDISPIRNKE